MNMTAIGNWIQARRREKGMTQAALSERLGVSPQAVSLWERGETLPDTGLLPDLARMLDASVDEMLNAGNPWQYRRKVTVAQMKEAMELIRRLRTLLGGDHFMYRAMIDGVDGKMNSAIEPALEDAHLFEVYVCEALMECVRRGDYVDVADLKANIHPCRALDCTLSYLREMGIR